MNATTSWCPLNRSILIILGSFSFSDIWLYLWSSFGSSAPYCFLDISCRNCEIKIFAHRSFALWIFKLFCHFMIFFEINFRTLLIFYHFYMIIISIKSWRSRFSPGTRLTLMIILEVSALCTKWYISIFVRLEIIDIQPKTTNWFWR